MNLLEPAAAGPPDGPAAGPPPEDFGDARTGRYWRALEDGRIQCELCPRDCKIRHGQRGLCFVRANWGGRMVLTTDNRSSGFCIDPIEKKPLNHFLPGTPVLSFGTAGCNLTCKFCQNHDISKARAFDKLSQYAAPEMIAKAAEDTGCRSVAFTYNDPVIFLEYAVDVARACRARGLKTVAVTAGYIHDAPRREFFAHMDAANVDLKAFTQDFYYSLCSAHLENVKETLAYLVRETEVWTEITDLLIPGHNDSDAEIEAMCAWIVETLGPDVPVHFTAFHPDWKMPDVPRTPPETLLRARKIALRAGINYVYTGNIHHKPAGSTWCPSCGALAIGRDWHELSDWNVKTGAGADAGRGAAACAAACAACGHALPGVFDGPPGTWGRKRRRVRFQAPAAAPG